MPALTFCCLFAGQPLAHASAAFSAANWGVAAREAWVQDPPEAVGPLLHDRQIQITAEGDERYEHTILRVTPAQVAEQATSVNIDVDPRFQELVIHSLRLTHGGDTPIVFSVAQIRAQLRTQSAEAEPQRRELNPRLEFALEVPGAHPGDLLEYDYTIHSRASKYPGLFAGHYAAEWSSDADEAGRWERLHVSWPPGRALQFRLSAAGTGVAPQVRAHPGELDIQWRNEPSVSEPDTPRWFERQGLVQLSDFGDWTQVAALLAPQYSGVEPQDLPIQPTANAAPGVILNAMRLLQMKVHPLNGIGNGPYVPADPAVVLQRGYGDGRDLARLLASLLRRLGIDAQVALAHSGRGAGLASTLPSPYILDSALVVVHAGNAEYWLNPAAPGPIATLQNADPADLRQALMLAATGGKIVDLPQPALDSRTRSVRQQFDLRAARTQPAALTVITQYRGSWAQGVHADLFSQSPAQLQLTQIQALVRDYPEATTDGDVQLQELPDGQTVQLTARFRIPHALGSEQDPHFDFFAEALAEAVQPREEATRQFPLSVPWPLQLEQHIEALLPPDFTVRPEKIQIDTAAFHYQREVHVAGGTLHITHSYIALSDHVEPADYPRFLQANAQVYEALSLRVRPSATGWQRALEWLESRLFIIGVLAVVAGTLARAAWRRLRGR